MALLPLVSLTTAFLCPLQQVVTPVASVLDYGGEKGLMQQSGGFMQQELVLHIKACGRDVQLGFTKTLLPRQ